MHYQDWLVSAAFFELQLRANQILPPCQASQGRMYEKMVEELFPIP